MTVIHECAACGYQGRVVQTPYDFLCERCDAEQVAADRQDMQCSSCGSEGVTETGICYACENSPKFVEAVSA